MIKNKLIIGVVFILIIGTIGCTELNDIETVSISGVGTEQTINRPGEKINVDVSGVNCDITVSKNTNLNRIELSGVDNIVRVSRAHSFTSDISGVDCEIVYYD